MRDNDLLDGFWDEEPMPSAPVPKFNRANGLLDRLMGVQTEDLVAEYTDAPKAKKRKTRTVVCKPVKGKKQRRKRKKFTKVDPGEAVDLLAAWEKKLLKARAMVQKYRQAVKRYQKQGRIK